MADNEPAKLVAEVSAGRITVGSETVNGLLELWLDHCESIGHAPTTMRKYRTCRWCHPARAGEDVDCRG